MEDSIIKKINEYIKYQITQYYKEKVMPLLQYDIDSNFLKCMMESALPIYPATIDMMLISTCLYFLVN